MARRIIQKVHNEAAVRGGVRTRFDFGLEADTERIPAIMLRPPDDHVPSPAALLLHGYTSHKEQMATTIGSALLENGIASLAIDLPLHGERAAGVDGIQYQATRNPMKLASMWKLAQREVMLSLEYLAAHRTVQADAIALVGYSMGSFLGVQAAADSRRVKALVLAAGGDLPENTPFTRIVRMFADPLKAVRRFDGKPLLMVHGRNDRTVTAEQAQRLFDAALEPKELRWWSAGHHLPREAIADATQWVKARLQSAQ